MLGLGEPDGPEQLISGDAVDLIFETFTSIAKSSTPLLDEFRGPFQERGATFRGRALRRGALNPIECRLALGGRRLLEKKDLSD